MPSLPKNKMAFWAIELDGVDITSVIRQAINELSVEYEVSKPTVAQFSCASYSFIEDHFTVGRSVLIKMGYDPNSLETMFYGQIGTNPEGAAGAYLEYTVTATELAELGRVQKNKIFNPPIKSAIVQRVVAGYGITAVVQIQDSRPLNPTEIPIQKGQTDLAFLMECAKKWGCLFWFDQPSKTVYFVDASKAHDVGNAQKKLSLEDKLPDYELGYRTDFVRNNVARISWNHGSAKGGNPGEPAVSGFSEDGFAKKPEDYRIEFEGVYYKLKPEYQSRAQSDPTIVLTETRLIALGNAGEARRALSQYYSPVNNSRTNKDVTDSHASNGGAGAALNMDIELNIGDPRLRAPRKAKLTAGSNNPKALNADLPGFLVNSRQKDGTQIFYINAVKTSISDGMMRTTMKAVR